MSPERPRLDIKGFREKGYLLEVNRRFFHPLGLALAVTTSNGEGPWTLECIFDLRALDPEGFVMGSWTQTDIDNARRIERELEGTEERRRMFDGSPIEPIPAEPQA